MNEKEEHRQTSRCINAASDAQSCVAPEIRGETGAPDFAAALKARYERLSLLTLDLAEEAGEAAVKLVDGRPGK